MFADEAFSAFMTLGIIRFNRLTREIAEYIHPKLSFSAYQYLSHFNSKRVPLIISLSMAAAIGAGVVAYLSNDTHPQFRWIHNGIDLSVATYARDIHLGISRIDSEEAFLRIKTKLMNRVYVAIPLVQRVKLLAREMHVHPLSIYLNSRGKINTSYHWLNYWTPCNSVERENVIYY